MSDTRRKFRFSYVPASQFVGRRWHRYLIPCRITLAHNPPIYRWVAWNFSWRTRV